MSKRYEVVCDYCRVVIVNPHLNVYKPKILKRQLNGYRFEIDIHITPRPDFHKHCFKAFVKELIDEL